MKGVYIINPVMAADSPDVTDVLVAVPHCRTVEASEVPRVDQSVVGHDHVTVGRAKVITVITNH